MFRNYSFLGLIALFLCLPVPVQGQEPARPLPLSSSDSASDIAYQGPTVPQQRAMFAAEQRLLRMEYNNWIGYNPLRPNMNGSYMSNGVHRYYIPSRGVIVSAGNSRSWYW